MTKLKAWKSNDTSQPSFPSTFKVTKRWEGNCTEIAKNSNKFYHAEIQVAANGQARIFTMYGRVGNAGVSEHRYYPSENACLSDYESLIKKKRDRKTNPYREVDLAITSIGSDGAKEIKKPMTGMSVKGATNKSTHHKEVQRLVSSWFGSTGHFVEMNLKCPLGQLTKEQTDKGREVLDECRLLINSKKKVPTLEYDTLTSQFYSLIPHVLPHRIDPNALRLDTLDRIMEKHDTLDTFLDAKNVAAVLGKGAQVDEQYKKLKSKLDWVDPKDPTYQWIEQLIHETRARNHSWLGKVKVFNIFTLDRNGATDHFNNSLAKLAKRVNGKGHKPQFTKLTRPDLDKDERKEFLKANVWPLWHGTRPQNMVGIISRGLLIRPAGAVHTGSMFGDALYHAESSSKSMNYTGCRGAHYTGSSGSERSFLFLEDVIVGNPHVVQRSNFFREPPRGYDSVYAIPGNGLVNSENMTYKSSGDGQLHRLKYIIEFQANT